YYNEPYIIDILDPETYQKKTIQISPTNGISGMPRSLFTDRALNIFLPTLSSDGIKIFQIDSEGETTLVLEIPERRQQVSTEIKCQHLSDNSFLIFDEEKGMRWFDTDGTLLKNFQPKEFGIRNNKMPKKAFIIHEDIRGDVWISFKKHNGIYKWIPLAEEVFPVTELDKDEMFANIWEDQKGNLIIAKSEGVGFYPDSKGLWLYDLQKEWTDFSFLINEGIQITEIFSTNSFKKELILGMDTGMRIYHNQKSNIQSILANPIKDFERGYIIRDIDEDHNGNIYFARESMAWYKWHPTHEVLDTLQLFDPLTGDLISFNCGFNIHYDSLTNFLWTSSCNDLERGSLNKINLDSTHLSESFTYKYKFTSFIKSRYDNKFWLTYSNQNGIDGIVILDEENGTFSPYVGPNGENPINGYSRVIYEGADLTLWVGTDKGLFEIDRDQQEITFYSTDIHDDRSKNLSNERIYEVYDPGDGKIWIGTMSGLNILDRSTGKIKKYTTRHGLPNSTVCGIVPDNNGNYWLSTFDGLSYFEPEAETFKNFFQQDGLSHNEFNRFSYHKAKDGTLYFGTVNGLNYFDPDKLLTDTSASDILIAQFKQFNKQIDDLEVFDRNLSNKSSFIIPSYIAYFEFVFALTDLNNPEGHRYTTWLEGFDEGWSEVKEANFVKYTRIPPGKYTLHIKGANAKGSWSKPASLKIIVKQKFYKTRWFLALCVIGSLLLGYLILSYFLRQRLAIEQLRTKISSDLHDEVSGLLAGIAIQSDLVYHNVTNDDDKGKLKLIGEVSRKAISKMSDVLWSIDSRYDKFEDLIKRMREYLSESLDPQDIDHYLIEKKINLSAKVDAHIRQDLYLIFKEAINNVVKHSNATEVRVQVLHENNVFKMLIIDNGTPSQSTYNATPTKRKGQGLSNMYLRANRLKGQLDISKRSGYQISFTMKRFA
ncbi:MAG: triple tyrosine motif-containing protein, partial [Bacteroidota bacterium]